MMASVAAEELTAAAKAPGIAACRSWPGSGSCRAPRRRPPPSPRSRRRTSRPPMLTIARPPLMKPSSDEAKSMRRREMPRGVHDRAGEDEERDREEREIGGALEHDERHIGQHVGPWMMTIASTATTPSATATGTLISTRAKRHDEHQRDAQDAPPAARRAADRRDAAPAPLGNPTSVQQRQRSLGNDEEDGPDRDHRLGEPERYPGQAHELSPPRTPSTGTGPGEHPEEGETRASAKTAAPTRSRAAACATSSGKPMCARFSAASAEP